MLTRKFQIQQNPSNFWMDTEVLDSGSLSGRVEPVSPIKQIHLPEVGSQQIMATEAPSFAQVRQMRLASIATDEPNFARARLPLLKQFTAIYLIGANQCRMSAQRLSKSIGVFRTSSYWTLRSSRQSMRNRNRCYWRVCVPLQPPIPVTSVVVLIQASLPWFCLDAWFGIAKCSFARYHMKLV